MWGFFLSLLVCSAFYWPEQVEAQMLLNVPLNFDFGSGDGEINPYRRSLPPTCTHEYQKEKAHTMCMQDDPKVLNSGVNMVDQKRIVALHNSLRAKVNPPATDLTKLIWDPKLAAVADKWAKQCVVGHDTNRAIPSYGMVIGQNVAAGQRSWHLAIMHWYREVKDYQYGKDPNTYLGRNGWKKIGHYTQLVQNDTYRIGCGFANCKSTTYGRYYVCNYAKGQSKLDFPYTSGGRCAQCPKSCWNGLCDCDGQICLNQGKLDLNTCQCTCPAIYSGSNCSTLNCPAKDPSYCGRDITFTDCIKYANVPHLCPYMCKLCKRKPGYTSRGQSQGGYIVQSPRPPKTTTTPAPQAVFVSPFNCTYVGRRGTKEECQRYGSGGMDSPFCASNSGQFGCSDCAKYQNVKTQYCPVMCGLCDAPCAGKKCLNGGKLNPRTCQCDCTALYKGATCERLHCPEEEKWHCHIYPPRFCTIYKNVPMDCPFLCGVCIKKYVSSPTIEVQARIGVSDSVSDSDDFSAYFK